MIRDNRKGPKNAFPKTRGCNYNSALSEKGKCDTKTCQPLCESLHAAPIGKARAPCTRFTPQGGRPIRGSRFASRRGAGKWRGVAATEARALEFTVLYIQLYSN